MKNRFRPLAVRALLVAAVAAAAIQLVPVEHHNPPARSEIVAPPEVRALLERSCYDCHSNYTRWPWYSYVAPVSWYLVDHVQDARGDLNLTEWPALDFETQLYLLEEIKEEVEEGEMPLPSYLLLHRGARLAEADRQLLLNWIAAESAVLAGPQIGNS